MKTILFLLSFLVMLGVFISPGLAVAQVTLPSPEEAIYQPPVVTQPPPNVPAGGGNPPPPPVPAGGGSPAVNLINPLGVNSIQEFFLKIIQIIIIFAIPLIIFFIMVSGFKYVTARGDTNQIKDATTGLTWSLIGGVLILGAQVILEIIKNTVAALQ